MICLCILQAVQSADARYDSPYRCEGCIGCVCPGQKGLKVGLLSSLVYRERQYISNKLCWRPPQYAPTPCKLTFDLLTLKVASNSRVTRATSVTKLVFLGLSVLETRLRPDVAYATDRQTSDVTRASSLNAPTLGVGA